MGCSLSVSWLNDQQIQDNQTWILFNNFCLSVLKTIIVEYAKWTEKMQIKRHLFSNNWQIWYRNLLVICRHVTIKDLKSKMLLLLLQFPWIQILRCCCWLMTNFDQNFIIGDLSKHQVEKLNMHLNIFYSKIDFECQYIKHTRTWRFTNIEWMELENSNGTHFQAVLCTILCAIFCTVLCTHSSDRVLSEISSQLQLVSCSTARPPDPSPLRPAQWANWWHEL